MLTSNGRPRLLVLSSTYPRWQGDHEPGFVHELCRRLTAQFQVTVLTSHTPGAQRHECMDGVEVVRYRYAPLAQQTLVYGGGMLGQLRRHPWKLLWLPGFILGQWIVARRLLRERDMQLVHAHWLVPQGLVGRLLASRRLGRPLVVTVHGSDAYRMRGWPWQAIKRFVARGCRLMTVVSSALGDELARQGVTAPRLEVLPMGLDMRQRYTPGHGVERSRHEVLFVGRLIAQKGLSWLLAAMPIVRRSCPRARLTVVGDGPALIQARQQAQALGLEDAVDFLGARAQDDLPPLYRRAGVFVAPFLDEEGLGMVVLEAAACECPMVVSDIGSMRGLFTSDDPVPRVALGRIDQLAKAIVSQLAAPPSSQARASLRQRFMRTHDWEASASAYARALRACLDDAQVDQRGD